MITVVSMVCLGAVVIIITAMHCCYRLMKHKIVGIVTDEGTQNVNYYDEIGTLDYRIMTVPPPIVGRRNSPIRDLVRESQEIYECTGIDDSIGRQNRQSMSIVTRQLQEQLPDYLSLSGEMDLIAKNDISPENEGTQIWSHDNGRQPGNKGTLNLPPSYEKQVDNATHMIHNNHNLEDIVYFYQLDQAENSSESDVTSDIIENILQWKSNVNIFEADEKHNESPLKEMTIGDIKSEVPSRKITDESSETVFETSISDITVGALKKTEMSNLNGDDNSSNDDDSLTINGCDNIYTVMPSARQSEHMYMSCDFSDNVEGNDDIKKSTDNQYINLQIWQSFDSDLY